MNIMRFFLILMMWAISTMTSAQTILQGTLFKNSILYNSPIYSDERELFPYNNYNVEFMTDLKLISTSEKSFNIEPYNTIGFQGNMELLNYDKFNGHYKFRFTFKPHIWLMGAKGGIGLGIQQKEIKNTKIYFSETNMDSIIIEGKLNHEFVKHYLGNNIGDGTEYVNLPKINELDSNPFIISTDNTTKNRNNELHISAQHDALITVIID